MRPPQKKRPWGGYDLRPGTAPGFVDTLGDTESNARIVVEFGADDLLFSHKNAADTSDAGVATAFVAQNYANRFIARKTVTLKTSTKPVAGPLIGAIVMLVFMVKDSQPGENQHGPSPKATAV